MNESRMGYKKMQHLIKQLPLHLCITSLFRYDRLVLVCDIIDTQI